MDELVEVILNTLVNFERIKSSIDSTLCYIFNSVRASSPKRECYVTFSYFNVYMHRELVTHLLLLYNYN